MRKKNKLSMRKMYERFSGKKKNIKFVRFIEKYEIVRFFDWATGTSVNPYNSRGVGKIRKSTINKVRISVNLLNWLVEKDDERTSILGKKIKVVKLVNWIKWK